MSDDAKKNTGLFIVPCHACGIETGCTCTAEQKQRVLDRLKEQLEALQRAADAPEQWGRVVER